MPSRIKQLHKERKRTTTPSDLLADLHIYIVPLDKWIPFRRLAKNQVVEETVSAGFVRVPPTSTLLSLRTFLQEQLDLDMPEFYVFIRSVGRNFTQVKTCQEQILKVKHFLPPQANEPELHVLEINPNLIGESGSVPNLILSDTDTMSESHGISSVYSGRISGVGVEGQLSTTSRHDPHLEMSQNFTGRSSLSRGAETAFTACQNSMLEYRENGQPPTVMRATSDEDEENYDNLLPRAGRSHSLNLTPGDSTRSLRFRRGRKSVSTGSYPIGWQSTTQSSEEEPEDRFPDISRTSTERVNIPTVDSLHRSASLNLPRWVSQESLSEGRPCDFKGSRSRQLDSSIHRGHRSLSTSAVERKGEMWTQKPHSEAVVSLGLNKNQPQDQRTLYAPHKWMQQREARRKARVVEKELELMREAKKLEEAKKFEEQIRKEEEMLRRTGRLDRPQETPEILTLEDPNLTMTQDIVVKTRRPRSFRQSDLTFSPDGSQDVQIRELRSGPQADAYEVTYSFPRGFSEKDNKETEENRRRNNIKGGSRGGINPFKRRGRGIRKNNYKKGEINNEQGMKQEDRAKNEEHGLSKHEDDQGEKSKRIIRSDRNTSHLQAEESDAEKKQKERQMSEEERNGGENGKTSHETRQSKFEYERTRNRFKHGSTREIRSTSVSTRKNASSHKGSAVRKEELEVIRNEKVKFEERRTELFTKARGLHEQILLIREKRRQQWWEEYNHFRRKGVRLEERQANLRQELESLYRKIIGTLMRSQPLITGVRDEPSRKASYKISVIRLRHEVSDLLRRVEAIDIKLNAEIRLRQQASKEVKQLRSEVSRKKANVALSQSRTPLLRNIAFIPDDILIRL